MKIRRIVRWALWVIVFCMVLVLLGGTIAYYRSDNDCASYASSPSHPMKAILHCEYGPTSTLRLANIEKPTPKDDEVLVKIRAAAINPLDWHLVEGIPYVGRAMGMGLRKPASTRLGVDYAGVIEAVGKNVTAFKPGEEVFGAKTGSLAEYLCVSADRAVVSKPANLSFAEAAAVPVAATTALQGLRDTGKLKTGEKVLINGASGGVGTYAVQIAKALGAQVTGVCSTRNLELVRSLGADHVIDYTKEDFAQTQRGYDVIFDNVPSHTLSECRQVLSPKGRYVLVGGGGPNDGRWIGPMGRAILAPILSLFSSQKMSFFLAKITKQEMTLLRDMLASGKLRSVIDRSYRLNEVPQAIRYLEEGHARGKVIINLD